MWQIGLKFVNTMHEVLDIVIVTCEIVVNRMLKLKCVTSKNLPPNEAPSYFITVIVYWIPE